VEEKNNQSVHLPSQGAAIFFAVSDDLKQRVSKVKGTIYNNLQSLHFNLQS
jgi:hypothetical protein